MNTIGWTFVVVVVDVVDDEDEATLKGTVKLPLKTAERMAQSRPTEGDEDEIIAGVFV